MIIQGSNIAGKIYETIKHDISVRTDVLKLVAVLVGDDASSLRYIAQKQKWAEYVGISFELKQYPVSISEAEILSVLHTLNHDESVTGYIIQLPLPDHMNAHRIIESIDPHKDVDGFHPQNQGKIMTGQDDGLICCTPAGIMHILSEQGVALSGKKVTVIGRSNIVGKPIMNLLINAGATVTLCNSRTPNISVYTRDSDIVVLATGVPGLLKSDMISGDCIVIDVGFSVVDGKIYGDACFDDIQAQGNPITPVPGGVGPLTVAFLMKNTLRAAEKRDQRKS